MTMRDTMTRTHNPTKYIFVTGGVASSLGKGIAASALGAILEARGLRISFVKLDPYLNIDPGTLNPKEHGEVFVTEDGAVTDLDLGHYERFSSALLSKHNNFTSGQIYHRVLSKSAKARFWVGPSKWCRTSPKRSNARCVTLPKVMTS